MFENSPLAILALGRSLVRRRILALLLDKPGTRLHLREIQRRAGTSPGTASRELGRLVAAGLITREAEGNQVYFRSSGSRAASLLLGLLTGAANPAVSSPVVEPYSAGAAPKAAPARVAPRPVPSRSLAPSAAATPASVARASATPEEISSSLQSAAATPGIAPDTAPYRPSRPIEVPPRKAPSSLAAPTHPEVAKPSLRPAAAAIGISPDPAPHRAAGAIQIAAPQAHDVPPTATLRLAVPAAPRQGTVSAENEAVPLGPVLSRPPAVADASEMDARIAAIQAIGPVDTVAARVGAMLAPRLRWLYGDRLRGLCLFGARVSGRPSPNADVELLVILDGVDRYGEELERTSLACASLSLDMDVVVSRAFVSEKDWLEGSGGRLAAIRAEGVML